MKIQYVHNNVDFEQKHTYCFVIPEYSDIMSSVYLYLAGIERVFVNVSIGIAKCHPKDQYNKATGREMAYSNISLEEFEIKKLESWSESEEIILWLYSESLKRSVKVILKKRSRQIKFVNVIEEM